MLYHSKKLAAQVSVVIGLSIVLLTSAYAEERVERATQFQDWTVTCSDSREAQRCVMVQLLKQADQEQPFLRVELSETPSDGLSGVIVTPFGLDISKGISLSIDGGERWNLPFRTCQNFGCVVRINVRREIVDRLKRGNDLEVFLYTLDSSGSLNVSVSLRGFSAAHRAL